MTPPGDKKKPKRHIELPEAWHSIHDQEASIANSPTSLDWKLVLIVLGFIVLVGAGVAYAIANAEPAEPWLDLHSVRVDSDEGYLYLLISTAADHAEPDWSKVAFHVGIDTYDADRGARSFPDLDYRTDSGIEFFLDIRGPGTTELRVIEGYDPYDEEKPIASPRDAEGVGFREMKLETNRLRFARSGEQIPPIFVDRGPLRFGTLEVGKPDFDSRTDISTGSGSIEIRLPWALLNVSDPSSRRVLHSDRPGRLEIGTATTNGFRIYVATSDPSSPKRKTADAIPASGRLAPLYRWESWETATFEIEPKLGVPLIRDAMNAIPDYVVGTDR